MVPPSSPDVWSLSSTTTSTTLASQNTTASRPPHRRELHEEGQRLLKFLFCDDSGSETSSETHSSSRTEQFEAIEDVRMPLQPTSRPQLRWQLRQRFFDLHFGPQSKSPAVFIYAAGEDIDKSGAIAGAMDTLCVAQLATTFHDEGLARTSAVMYSNSIQQLNRELNMLSSAVADDPRFEKVYNAIDVLISCSWFAAVEAGRSDWVRHMRGMIDIVPKYGLTPIRPSLRSPVFAAWQHNSVMQRLHFRWNSRLQLAKPADVPDETVGGASVFDIAFHVPDLLVQTDRLIFAAEIEGPVGKQQQAIELLTRLGGMIALLKKWQYESVLCTAERYQILPTRSSVFDNYRAITRDCLPGPDFAYSFKAPGYELPFRISAISILKCQQAMLALHRRMNTILCANTFDVEQEALQLQRRIVHQDASSTAQELCMLVPWSSHPDDINVGCVSAFRLLYEASEYYKAEGLSGEEELQWCKQVREALASKYGIRIHFVT